MKTFNVESLDSLAMLLEFRAQQCEEIARRTSGVNAKKLEFAIAQTYRNAANIVRDTEIRPTVNVISGSPRVIDIKGFAP